MNKKIQGNLNFRLERPDEYDIVEELSRDAHWDGTWEITPTISEIPLLVSRLRECPSYVPELHYAAELDGKLVGHIIYSTSKIIDDSGKEHEMLTFGPLSVLPDYQHLGIGKALMHHSFEAAKKLGYRAVLIFGHPDYYPRVGFHRASEFGITTSDGGNFDPFMVYPLYEGALDGIQGRFYIDPVYENLVYEDVVAYDKKFPPKEIYIPVHIDVLFERLDPAAQNALAELKSKALKVMTTKSEREIFAMDGIDSRAIETIRAVMLEHGFRWGKK